MGKLQIPISWVRKENIHLTLNFLGNLPESKLEDLINMIESITSHFPPVNLSIEGTGVFPDLKRPRVLWVGTGGDIARLTLLQKSLVERLKTFPIEIENRPFKAHITLGRIKTWENSQKLDNLIREKKNLQFGNFQVDEIILFKSDLTPKGAIYTKIKAFRLMGSKNN